MSRQKDPESGAELPHSVRAEQAILGCLMADPVAFDRVADQLTEQDFYRRAHQLIFRAVKEAIECNRPCDAVILGEWFESRGQSELIAGGAYLVELASAAATVANIHAYAEIVSNKAALRRLIGVCTGIANEALQFDGRDSTELLATAEREVRAIAEDVAHGRSDFAAMLNVARDAYHILHGRSEHQGIVGLPTGYDELDAMTNGLQPADLIILGARPAMGKTTFALNVAEHVANKSKKSVAVFSMEMSAVQLAIRLISSCGRIDTTRLRSGQLKYQDWNRVSAAIRMIKDTNIYIDDTPTLSPESLRAKARQLKREHGLGLIVVDHLQLMRLPGDDIDRGEALTEIVRSMKLMAKELEVPVIALSQLNRALERRADKRPVLSDLRGSGAMEDEADLVLFIYRDEYYRKERTQDRGLAEIIIAKQRNGPTGCVMLKFLGKHLRFDNLADASAGVFE